jgi:hypothetical protein
VDGARLTVPLALQPHTSILPRTSTKTSHTQIEQASARTCRSGTHAHAHTARSGRAGLSSDLRSGREDFALNALGPNDAHHRLHARFRVSPCDVQGRDWRHQHAPRNVQDATIRHANECHATIQHHEDMAQLQQCNVSISTMQHGTIATAASFISQHEMR